MSLWSAKEAALATGGSASGDWVASGVSIDTRTLQPGDLFVALKAERDGHDFVAQALEKGAAAALVSRVPEGVSQDAPLLVVKDVLEGLEALGMAARARTKARVVAVTGSVGKTSTKEMLRDALSGQGKTHVAEASYNNHWGVPLTLARMPVETEFAVIEIGMNHPGEIAPLTRMTRPHVAIVTTVAPAHLEAFESIDGIAREKAAIFEGLEVGGTAIINRDVETYPILEQIAQENAATVITFGENQDADYRALRVELTDTITRIEMQALDTPLLMKIAAPGRHFAMNALAVMAVVGTLKLDWAVALGDLGRWHPPTGRGTRETMIMDAVEDHLRFDLIDDAFNANPTSMAASLEVLAATKPTDNIGRYGKGRRIAILGDMLELGPDEARLHSGLADLAALNSLDIVHCVGPRMRFLFDVLPDNVRGSWFETAEELEHKVHGIIDAGDIVLIKGSKGSKVSRVVDALRKLGHSAPHQEEEDA